VDGEGTRCADEDCGERFGLERVRELRERGQVEPLVDERWSDLPAVGDSVLVQPALDGRLAVGPLERVEIARARRPSVIGSARARGEIGSPTRPPSASRR